jgi:hypothetical protein
MYHAVYHPIWRLRVPIPACLQPCNLNQEDSFTGVFSAAQSTNQHRDHRDNYSALTVEQGSGDYSSHVVVKKTDSGEFLLIIQSQNISNINDRDFSAI